MFVVAIYGTLGYNNNVQPFLIGTILEGYKKKSTSSLKHDRKCFALSKAGSGNGG